MTGVGAYKEGSRTTEQELNEKLMKFAGITHSSWSADPEYPYCDYPNGEGSTVCPDFLRSLEDCLEHLGPKFRQMEIQKVPPRANRPLWLIGLAVEYNWEFGEGDTPAMAFCMAAEEAIDKMKAAQKGAP